METVRSGNGFITQGDLLTRMHRFRPPQGDYYLMRKVKDRDFAEIGVSNKSFNGAMMRLFRIYAGTKELYAYIGDLYKKTADALNQEWKFEEWTPNGTEHRDGEGTATEAQG
jgi:hypothetical protein